MLNEQSLTVGERLALGLDAANVLITPKSGTPMDLLIHTSRMVPRGDLGDVSEVDLIRETAQPINGYDPHSEFLANSVPAYSDRLLANMGLVRNVVNPLIEEIFEGCAKEQREIASQSPLNIQTHMVTVPSLMKSSQLVDQYSIYQNARLIFSAIDERLRQSIISGLTDEAIVDALDTKGQDWKTAVEDLLTRAHQKYGDGLFNALLLETPLRPNSVSMFENVLPTLNLLLLKAVTAGRVSVSDEVNSNQNQTALSRMIAYYGTTLFQQMNMISAFRNSGRFLIPVVDTTIDRPEGLVHDIYLYQVNYEQWLSKEGNDVDLLLGAVAAGRSGLGIISSALVDNPQQYAGEYERIAKRDSIRNTNASDVELKNVIASHLYAYIAETDEIQDKTEMAKKVRTYLKMNTLRVNTDLLPYIRNIVCEVAAPNSMSRMLLEKIDNYLAADDTMTIDQAAVYATISSAAEWLVNQVKVEQLGNDYQIFANGGDI